ncbi:GntR family transcriptional regulator [Aeromicrobium camelliae]|uniref:GntR family transcriptional regulator n=1 Tax=Aeromicrobium camelliae TaxID=1538144 RepID=A0A3N6W4V3_9ACTN|nr:GntR family transcriptional regulator [Aeromicrobium camelliae]RQN02520.1 GntR family transcriptional regulator [Aeromicrobium camelliae]
MKLETESATERAYRHVKARLLDGSLPGGSMTSEGEISAEIGLSRTPVREAFLRLEAEGLLRLYPKRGALVVPVSPAEADDVIEARLLVETHAGRRAAALPDAQHRRLVELLRDIVTAQESAVEDGDLGGYAVLDARFHQEIVVAVGNEVLRTFSVGLRERQQRMIAHSVRWDASHVARFVEGHRSLLDALERRDGDAYADLLVQHLEDARAGL